MKKNDLPPDEYVIYILSKHIKGSSMLSCYEWEGGKTSGGYPTIKIGGRYGPVTTAHSKVCEIFHWPKPPNFRYMISMHSCNNPGCLNPRHLSWGTQSSNLRQAYRQGRR